MFCQRASSQLADSLVSCRTNSLAKGSNHLEGVNFITSRTIDFDTDMLAEKADKMEVLEEEAGRPISLVYMTAEKL